MIVTFKRWKTRVYRTSRYGTVGFWFVCFNAPRQSKQVVALGCVLMPSVASPPRDSMCGTAHARTREDLTRSSSLSMHRTFIGNTGRGFVAVVFKQIQEYCSKIICCELVAENTPQILIARFRDQL